MKKLSCLLIIFCVAAVPVWAQQSSVACLGNGSMAVYETKADIIQIFGPPYSAPSIMSMQLDSSLHVVSQREKGTAVWKHVVSRDGKQVAVITDFVASNYPCFIRQVTCSEPIDFSIAIPANMGWIDNSNNYREDSVTQSALLKTPAGTYFYSTYPMPTESYHQVLIKGAATISNNHCSFGTGNSEMMIIGGTNYPACITNTHQILERGTAKLLIDTRKCWMDFTAERIDFANTIPANVPQREKLLQTIDDVSVIIKTQQSMLGAVLAGHNYHLGYIRDQYGVSRCLLKLGYYKEAKAILQFYNDIWQQKKELHNAQGIGVDAFHVHENDGVEITGYLIIQAFDYLQKTKDAVFIKTIFPMLEWAWQQQTKNLLKYMLPFNGDETYVAGGILPRTTLLDGSAEATLLLVTGGDQLLSWIDKQHLWPATSITKNRQLVKQVKDHYNENFIDSGQLLTNNPKRMLGAVYPQFRHGVCESLVAPCEVFGWTQKTTNNRYLCPVCFASKTLPPVMPQKFFIQSVSLTPFYINATMLPEKLVRSFVLHIVDAYKATGNFPSSPNIKGKIVGYDYGLFLYSLTKLDNPLKSEIYTQMMDVLDDTGAWVEYYQDNQPMGTRYRPWESGINLEAAIDFAQQYK